MPVRDEPLPVQVFEQTTAFTPPTAAVYIYGHLPEDRSEHVESWRNANSGTRAIEITSQSSAEIELKIGDASVKLPLRSARQLSSFWSSFAGSDVYMDITGLEHQVWAPLLQTAIANRVSLYVVYVEPAKYSYSPTPTDGQIFDLSARISGIAPLPGFANLADQASTDDWFIPLLGFEGTRLRHVIEHVQPAADRIIPVIGIPGFRPEYPFHAYLGNKGALEETESWASVRYAQANCPFSLYYLLKSISRDRPNGTLMIAPIGTKPHGLGAILFKIASQRAVEIIYDHPVRSKKRTEGTDRLFVYSISAFLGSARP